MPNFTKPTDIPRWGDGVTNTVEPPSGKKDIGWLNSEAPPSSYENWLMHANGEWVQWTDERWADADAGDSLSYVDPGTTLVHTTFRTGGNIEFSGIFDQDRVSVNGTDVGSGLGIAGMYLNGTLMQFHGTDDDYYLISLSNGSHFWYENATIRMELDSSGLNIRQGLHVGANISPLDDAISIGPDTTFLLQADGGGDNYVRFGGGGGTEDRILWDSSDDQFVFQVDGSSRVKLGLDGSAVGIPWIGDSDHRLVLSAGGDPVWFADVSGDSRCTYDRSSAFFRWRVSGVDEFRVDSDGARVEDGLVVGDVSSAPTAQGVLRLVPQASEAGASVGDMQTTDGGKLRVFTGAAGYTHDRVVQQSLAEAPGVGGDSLSGVTSSGSQFATNYTVPADTLKVGSTVRARGLIEITGVTGAPTGVNASIRIGSLPTAEFDTGVLPVVGQTIFFDITCVVTTAGGSGDFSSMATGSNSSAADSTPGFPNIADGTSLDTTVANLIEARVRPFSAATDIDADLRMLIIDVN